MGAATAFAYIRQWPLRIARQDSHWPILLGVVGLIAYLSLSPTIMLLYGSFKSEPLGVPGGLTLSNYINVYADPVTYELLLNSLVFAGGSSIFSVALATALAWITVRTNAPFRRVFELSAIIPNIFPPIMMAVSWTLLLSPRIGLINRMLMGLLGLESAPLNIYSMTGMIFVEGLITAPLAFLIISGALYSMDPALEESARVAGSGNIQIAWRITFPIVRPAILAAVTLNFVRAIEGFDTPAIIALPTRIEVFTTKIFREAIGAYPPNHNVAATYAMTLLAITMFLVYVYRKLTVRTEAYVTVTGRGYRPTLVDLGRWRYAATVIAGVILFFSAILPFIVLIYGSVVSYIHPPSPKTMSLLTTEHYAYILTDRRTYEAFRTSLFLAITGATLCMLLASLTAYITVKTKTVGRGAIEALTFIPWAFPGTALAIGLLYLYIQIDLPIYATIWIILIGYITRFLPYGLRSMTSTIVQIHNELEDASKACGAGFLPTFCRILLPLMRPGFIAGWIILATIFLREFSISVFLYTPNAEPIGPRLYHFFIDGEIGPMSSLAVIVSIVSIILIVVARRLGKMETYYQSG